MLNKVKKVEVSAPARIHLGLIDCGFATDRQYGGAGISVDGLFTKLTCRPSKNWEITFNELLDISQRTFLEVDSLLNRLDEFVHPSSIVVDSMAPEHTGFGSKTALLLSITASVFAADQKEINKDEIVKITRRGGASGIGVNSFWNGGLIVDAGHAIAKNERVFTPSSCRIPTRLPPIISSKELPHNWRIALFYDPKTSRVGGEREIQFFRENLPIENLQCLTTMALIFHGLLPSVHEQDLSSFKKIVRSLNETGMKKVEVAYQTTSTQQFLKNLWEKECGAGLSSFGPGVFVIDESTGNDFIFAENIASKLGLLKIGEYGFRNSGASITTEYGT